VDIPKGRLILLFELMLKIRHFEDRVRTLFAAGELPGFVHLYLGQEAIAAGACAALRDDDYITSTHRGHGHIIAKGGDMKRMMAELYAKATGYNKAKGGSLHIADPSIGILGANGIVGAGIPIATGAALSAKLRKTDQVTICFFGDGATGQGTFHEAINLASTFALPIVYVCENNLYAVGTRTRESRNIEDIADRGTGYGIPGLAIDGNNVVAVYEATKEAVDRARNGEGPTLIECKTYRWHTHFEGEPDTYRDPAEVEEWRAKEPIGRLKATLVKEGVVTEDEAQAIEQRVMEELEEAVRFAYESPAPDVAEALTDVYAE
jgi:TPP-dependent pyruvate/acetoin dehydrogenase alpha subunit